MNYLHKNANISECLRYREMLIRVWDPAKPIAMFVGLNPSTAGPDLDDSTIRKEVSFADSWGYGTLLKANLFALRETHPERMLCESQPIGKDNDAWISSMAAQSGIIICAWGNDGGHLDRDRDVLGLLLTRHAKKLHYLKMNVTGHPAHPLYLSGKLKPIFWENPLSRKPLNIHTIAKHVRA